MLERWLFRLSVLGVVLVPAGFLAAGSLVYGINVPYMDQWGVAAPPSPELRAAMTGEPDKGWAA